MTTTTTRDHWNGWACTDCATFIANGETPPGWSEYRTAKWLSRIEELSTGTTHVTLGRLCGEDGCEHDDPNDEEHATQCERIEFSWSWCDHCGERLAGERLAITGWLPDEPNSLDAK